MGCHLCQNYKEPSIYKGSTPHINVLFRVYNISSPLHAAITKRGAIQCWCFFPKVCPYTLALGKETHFKKWSPYILKFQFNDNNMFLSLFLHCKNTRVVLTELAWLTQLRSESMHSKMLSHAVREQSGLRSWYSNVPACYQSKSYNVHTMCLLVIKGSLKSLQCACLLPKCLLKAYNVCLLPMCLLKSLYNMSACYQNLHK